MIDDHSRFLVASDVRKITKAADVVATFHRAAAAHGFPASMLTDNGAVFTAAPRKGRCAIELETAALGIGYVHSSPYHPQTCGKVERFHQTEKKWLAKQKPAATLLELQAKLDRFGAYYNDVRPHRAIGRRTPAEAFAARPRATPRLRGFVVPAHFRVRRDKVDITGTITLRHNSRLHHIGLGRRLDRHPGARARGRSRRPGAERRRRADPQAHPRSDPRLPASRAIVRWKDVPRHIGTMSRDITQCPGRDSNLRPVARKLSGNEPCAFPQVRHLTSERKASG